MGDTNTLVTCLVSFFMELDGVFSSGRMSKDAHPALALPIRNHTLPFLFLCRIAGHPLAQNEKCLHMFLQDPVVDRSYVPGKVRSN